MDMIANTSAEISDPVEAARMLKLTRAVAYAPGDGYRYGVALVKWGEVASVPESLIVQGGPLNPMHMLRFDPPQTDWDQWDHHRWERHQMPESVYNGLMPLLAALGWAGDRKPIFNRDAVREFE